MPKRLLNAKLILGALLAVSFLLALLFSPLRHYVTFHHIVSIVEDARQNRWGTFLFYCIFTVAILGLPVTLFPIIGGVLFPFWIAFPLNLLAATVGSWMAFKIARFFGREAIESLLKGKLRMFDHVAAVEGFQTVAILRIVGIPPFVLANYALGLSGISSKDFILGTIAGIIPWMAMVTFTAHSLWQAVLMGGEKGLSMELFKTMGPLMILSGVIVVATVIILLVKRRKKKRAHSNL